MNDPVNHPSHYNSHPSGVECITVTEHMSFCLGNAVKYIWRAGLKDDALQDLKKARFYLDREIAKREKATARRGILCDIADPDEVAAAHASHGHTIEAGVGCEEKAT